MKLSQWLEAERGRATALADHLGCTKSMVSQMASGGVRVPPGYYRAIRDFTGGEVSLEDLLPQGEPDAGKPLSKLTEAPAAAEPRRFIERDGERRHAGSPIAFDPDPRQLPRRRSDLETEKAS